MSPHLPSSRGPSSPASLKLSSKAPSSTTPSLRLIPSSTTSSKAPSSYTPPPKVSTSYNTLSHIPWSQTPTSEVMSAYEPESYAPSSHASRQPSFRPPPFPSTYSRPSSKPRSSSTSSDLPLSSKLLYSKAKSSMPTSSANSSTISDIIKSHHLEHILPLDKGSLASKIHYLHDSPRASDSNSPLPTLPRADEFSPHHSEFPHPLSCRSSSHSPSYPTPLELNAALLEYLSTSPAKLVFDLLRSWDASWGFFSFDRESVFGVLDELVNGIMDGVAELTRDWLGKGGVSVEKEEILRVLGWLKEVVGGRISGFFRINETGGQAQRPRENGR